MPFPALLSLSMLSFLNGMFFLFIPARLHSFHSKPKWRFNAVHIFWEAAACSVHLSSFMSQSMFHKIGSIKCMYSSNVLFDNNDIHCFICLLINIKHLIYAIHCVKHKWHNYEKTQVILSWSLWQNLMMISSPIFITTVLTQCLRYEVSDKYSKARKRVREWENEREREKGKLRNRD